MSDDDLLIALTQVRIAERRDERRWPTDCSHAGEDRWAPRWATMTYW